MKKKLIAIGIIGMFMLMGLVSLGGARSRLDVPEPRMRIIKPEDGSFVTLPLVVECRAYSEVDVVSFCFYYDNCYNHELPVYRNPVTRTFRFAWFEPDAEGQKVTIMATGYHEYDDGSSAHAGSAEPIEVTVLASLDSISMPPMLTFLR